MRHPSFAERNGRQIGIDATISWNAQRFLSYAAGKAAQGSADVTAAGNRVRV
jgi:hypothetical protein